MFYVSNKRNNATHPTNINRTRFQINVNVFCAVSRVPLFILFLKDLETGVLYELVCREHGQELVDELIRDGKATAIETGNSVFMKIRKLEWSEIQMLTAV
jgi:hypothetical protein